MSDERSHVINIADAEDVEHLDGDHWGGYYKVLTPNLPRKGGRLGVNATRLPPGRALCPFHYHTLEDEVFYVLSGRGVLRYGDDVREIGPGDCITCPAGNGVAHQIANTFEEDLVYLAIGPNRDDEVCVYPDTGKVYVRNIRRVGYLENVDYMEGELDRPKIFEMAADLKK